MPLLADRVRETSATTGTGTMTLAGAVTGYQGFNAAFTNGDTVYYVIHYATEWEVGIGTVGTGTLSRNTVLQSSNGDALVPFSAGTKDVFVAYVAGRAVTTSDAATLTHKTIDDYTNDIGANSTHFRVKANGTIGKGAVIKATGFVPGEQAIEVGLVASATDTAIGIMEQALTVGQFGMAVVIGELFNVNTNAFAFNDVLYSNGSGGLTATKPSSGKYQTLGTVVRANTNNGVIAVNIVAPQFVEAGTNTANTLVLRDGSGNFAAGTITAALTGNASTATALATARNINGVSFNGTSDITVTAAAGTLSGATLAANVLASSLTSVGTLANLTVTNPITGSVTGSSGSTTGNAATATALATARNINGVSFNGTANITVTAAAGTLSGSTLASGVTASSLTSVGTLTALTVSGNLTVDTNTLFVDAANNRVGVGTATPGATFESVGTSNGATIELLRLNNAGSGANTQAQINFIAASASYGTITSGFGASAPQMTFNLPSATAGNYVWQVTSADVMRLQSGNLGLGVTPSATWASTSRAFQLKSYSALFESVVGKTTLSFNAVETASNTFNYLQNEFATMYQQVSGVHSWLTAPSGTAGTAISFTQAMTLDASSNLLVGPTSGVGGAKVAASGTFLSTTNTLSTFSGAYGGFDWTSRSLRLFAGTADATGSQIEFYAGVSGAINVKARIDNTATAGHTALLLWDVDNATLERVTVGAADSGGTGFKVLRIPN